MTQPAEQLGLVGLEPAENRDQQAVAAGAPGAHERRGEGWPPARGDDSQGVQKQALRRTVALVGGVGGQVTVAGHQPDEITVASEMDPDRGGGADRPLERRARTVAPVRVLAAVQHHRGPALPWLLLTTHHELAVAGRRAPVHPAQVVTLAILTGRHVVLTGAGHRPGPALAGAGPLTSESDRRECGDRWGDHEGVHRGEGAVELTESERVGQPDRQRTDAVAATQVRPDGVGDLPNALRLHPVQHEARPAAEDIGQRVLDEQYAGRQPGDVVELQHHRGRLAGGHPRRVEPAGAREPVARPVHHGERHCRQDQQEHPHPEEVAFAECQCADRGGNACGDEATAPGGEPGEGAAHYRS